MHHKVVCSLGFAMVLFTVSSTFSKIHVGFTMILEKVIMTCKYGMRHVLSKAAQLHRRSTTVIDM